MYHLRLLQKLDADWEWKDIHSEKIHQLKTHISEETYLKYSNRKLDNNLKAEAALLNANDLLLSLLSCSQHVNLITATLREILAVVYGIPKISYQFVKSSYILHHQD